MLWLQMVNWQKTYEYYESYGIYEQLENYEKYKLYKPLRNKTIKLDMYARQHSWPNNH